MLAAPAVSGVEGEDAEISALVGFASEPRAAAAGWADNAIHINAAKAPNKAGMGPSFFDTSPSPLMFASPCSRHGGLLRTVSQISWLMAKARRNGPHRLSMAEHFAFGRHRSRLSQKKPLIPERDKFVGPTFTGRAKGFWDNKKGGAFRLRPLNDRLDVRT
jgi:hypothetical protein